MNLESLYSILIGLGATLGLWRVYSKAESSQRNKYLGIGIWTLCGSLLGARLGFIIMHSHFFSNHREALARFWLGGMNGFGAIIGAILFILIAARVLHMHTLPTLDLMSSMVLPLGVMVWLGCWAAGTAYGRILEPGTWWGMMISDESGSISLRMPLQPMASITLYVILYIIEWQTRHAGSGLIFTWIGLGLSLHIFMFSFLRSDPIQTLFGWRLDSWLALFSAISFTVLLVILYKWISKKDKMNRKHPAKEETA